MARTKRIADKKPKFYCRKCMKMKLGLHFYKATDIFLDSSGYMSICKDCCQDIYDSFFISEKSVEKTLLRMCRLLNVQYNEKSIESAKQHIKTRADSGTTISNIFGIYKSKLIAIQRAQIGKKDVDEDMTFVEPSSDVIEAIPIDSTPDLAYYENAWGKGKDLGIEDYEYLESEFDKWQKTTQCDTQGEEVLVRLICHQQNKIRKARINGKSVDNLVKSLQEIMKNSALTPALQNAASSGKNYETFGKWVKDIEQKTPAEWWEDQEKFHDVDGMTEDKDDIIRSIKNFITNSRDFGTSELEGVSDIEDE